MVVNDSQSFLDPESNYFNPISSSEYISIEEYNNSCSRENNGIGIISYNIRSFNANSDSLFTMFHNIQSHPSILVLSETWFDNNSTQEISGYTGYHVTRMQGRSGGVSLYVRQTIVSKLIPELSFVNASIEVCTIQIKVGRSSEFYVLGIYRPCRGNLEDFMDNLDLILGSNVLRNKACVLTGDLNINLLSDETSVHNFVNSMQSLHYVPLVTKPTRFPSVQGHSPSLIDHVWVNDITRDYSCQIIANNFTDHCPIYLKIFTNRNFGVTEERREIKFRLVNDENINKFEDMLVSFDWNSLQTNDVNNYLLQFMNSLNSMYCRSFPIKSKFISKEKSEKPWITSSLKQLINSKSKMFRLFQLNLITHSENNTYKNRVKTIIKNHKNEYLREYFRSNYNNLRNTWNMIKTITQLNPNRNVPKSIFFNNYEYMTDPEIANVFNEYFYNTPRMLAESVPPTNTDPLSFVKNNHISSFYLYPIRELECMKIIMNLKNTKEGINNIPVTMFKRFSGVYVGVLCNIINLSFRTGTFPDILKIARITPVFKKGDRTNIANYRPIAIVPFISKILEKCLSSRLYSFLDRNSILSGSQFGFRSGLSTSDAISNLVEHLYETLNYRLTAVNIFVDFSRAFDTVDHSILIKKLQYYGIHGTPLKLFSNYLNNRKQFVQINGHSSTLKTIDIGIGQGTSLGPLLFLIYINDLPNISKHFRTILYADDSTLTFRGDSICGLNDVCNRELDKFFDWTNSNKLTVNIDKTYFNIVSNNLNITPSSFNLCLNGRVLERRSSVMFLGVVLDERLKFDLHVTHISSKISKSIGVLYKLKSLLPFPTLKSLYFSFVYPYLLYSNIVWGSTFSSHLHPLRMLQKRVIRIINGAQFLDHTNELFLRNSILKFDDVNYYLVAIFMFKNQDLPMFYRNHEHNTRNANFPNSQFQRLTLTQHSIYFTGPVVWNSLPLNVKNSSSLDQFKILLKNYLISRYAQL